MNFNFTSEEIVNKSNLLMLSGGVGSAVLLAYLKNMEMKLQAVFFIYQGRESEEQKSAEKLANYYGVDLTAVDLSRIYSNMPTDYPLEFRRMNDFYIPYRNGVFVSVAAAHAYFLGYRNLLWGLTSSSAAYYSDCSIHFFQSQSKAVYYGTNARVKLMAPFLGFSKLKITRLGKELDVPMELTWSCANNGKTPCGKCFGCIERENNLKLIENEDSEKYGQNKKFCFDCI